jgi:hypothetical protein
VNWRRPERFSTNPLLTAPMDRFHKLFVAAAAGVLSCMATAQPASKDQLKGLDEQVQDIKKDVLAISSELQLL